MSYMKYIHDKKKSKIKNEHKLIEVVNHYLHVFTATNILNDAQQFLFGKIDCNVAQTIFNV